MSLLTLSHDQFDSVLFDLDGVLTVSAALHASSWKKLFDKFLWDKDGDGFTPFDQDHDYRVFVDGKPRLDGVKAFLASRMIDLPAGKVDDPPSAATVHGLGCRKNLYFLNALAREGIRTFPAALIFLDAVRDAGHKTALVSSSQNARAIIDKAGLGDRFDGWIDGNDLARRGLRGKPAPDMFLSSARALGARPGRTVVIEDAIAGVQAARRGRFGLVITVDRTRHPDAFAAAGAHLVVAQLSEVPLACTHVEQNKACYRPPTTDDPL